MMKILKNKIMCNTCGEVIESTNRHDFKMCACGKVGVDGGTYYMKRCFTNGVDDFTDLSVCEEEVDEKWLNT